MQCTYCKEEMVYLKQYKFESQNNNRGLLAAIFDMEEHLIFDIHVCKKCRRTEFIYKGSSARLDG